MSTERFGHAADPAIDFQIEVASIQHDMFDLMNGLAPELTRDGIRSRLDRALSFNVGGVPDAVAAKQTLRALTFSTSRDIDPPDITEHSTILHLPSMTTWVLLGTRHGGKLVLRSKNDGTERVVMLTIGHPDRDDGFVAGDYQILDKVTTLEGMPEMECEQGDVIQHVVGGLELTYLGRLNSNDYPISRNDHVLRRSDGMLLNLPAGSFRAADYALLVDRSDVVARAQALLRDNPASPDADIVEDLLRLLVPPNESEILR